MIYLNFFIAKIFVSLQHVTWETIPKLIIIEQYHFQLSVTAATDRWIYPLALRNFPSSLDQINSENDKESVLQFKYHEDVVTHLTLHMFILHF